MSIQTIKYYLMEKSRRKKYGHMISLTQPDSKTTFLDIGVNDTEYSPFDNYFEKHFPYQQNITALSIIPLDKFPKRYPHVKTIVYDGGVFPFNDNEFSVVISNAVIEHVGNRKEQIDFINEITRVGKQFYFTTPAKEFPVEIHTNFPFIHWLPKKYFNFMVTSLGKGWAAGDYMNLLSKNNLEEVLLLSNCNNYKIITHWFGPLPLHYTVHGYS
jgi:SAM-dependent methyltransferase